MKHLKVLYVAHFQSGGSGWQQAATDYALALDSVGMDVVCRSVYAGSVSSPNPKIKELMDKDAKGCNVCIQHVLPHLMDHRSEIKQIGMAIFETDTTKPSGWCSKLKLMNEVWTPNMDAKEFLYRDGIKDIHVIPHCINPDKYHDYDDIKLPGLEESFVFYYIGEFNRRKRISAIVNAFHNEFDRTEPVSLVIKTHKSGCTPEQTHQLVKQTCTTVKDNLHKYKRASMYKPEYIISDRLTERQIMGLHHMGHAHVSAAFGEAWGMPIFDAYAMGNVSIAAKCGGPRDYLPPRWLVDGSYQPVIGGDVIFPNFNTSRENWYSVCLGELQRTMRRAYNEGLPEQKPDISRWTYQTVGNLMKDRLEQITDQRKDNDEGQIV